MTTAAAAAKGLGFTSLNDVLMYLVSHHYKDFYARIVSALPSRDDKRVPFMGVTFERGHHVLLYNGEWVEQQMNLGRKGFENLRATIAHEGMHVVLAHIARQVRLSKTYGDDKDKKRFLRRTNLATDMAANDLLNHEVSHYGREVAYSDMRDNPKEWVIPSHFDFPEGLTYEWYVSLLMDKKTCPQCAAQAVKSGGKPQSGEGGCKHDKGKGKGKDGESDDSDIEGKEGKHAGAHALWESIAEELSDEELEILTSQIEGDAYEKLKTAIEEQRKTRGTIPGFAEEQLSALNKPPVVPWKKLLHKFVSRCRLSKPLRSMERPRKRWLNLGSTFFPGRKRDTTFKLLFTIDTSGSMSSTDIHDGLTELQGILRVDKDIEVIVVEFDTQIHKEYTLKAGEEPDVKVRGRGGTDFNAAFERAKELGKKGEVDALIVFTDGYAPSPDLQFRPQNLPVLWCLTEGGEHPCPGYGHEIRRPRN